MKHPTLDSITSLRSSSCPTIAYEQFGGNIRQTTSKSELAIYHHQAMGSPPQTTFLRAIKKYPQLFATYPGLTYELIRKRLPLSTTTLKSRMIHRQQGLDSAGSERKELQDARKSVTDMTPAEHVCAAYKDKIYCLAAIRDTNENTLYNDLTRQFPLQSYGGMVHIFVASV